MKFEGSYVALITPFKNNGTELDEDKLRELVNYHIENGTAGIVPCGTTGEAPTLTFAEHEKVIKIVVEEVKGRIQVIAGAGSNNTSRAVELTKYAKELGADAALSTCPYYNKPSQRGLYEHYKTIAQEAKFPVMLYNVPGRTGQVMAPETILHLSQHKNIVAYKDAVGDIAHTLAVRNLVGENIDIYSGNDDINVPIILAGGKGTISVLANVYPKATHLMCKYALERQVDKAFGLQLKYLDFIHMLFAEPNPMPVKKCVELIGKSACHYRLPMTHIAPTLATRLEQEIARLNSLQGE